MYLDVSYLSSSKITRNDNDIAAESTIRALIVVCYFSSSCLKNAIKS
jgi:hypothetical protein